MPQSFDPAGARCRRTREALDLAAGDQLIAETTPEGLMLRPAMTSPIELYSEERLREFEEAEAELTAVRDRKLR